MNKIILIGNISTTLEMKQVGQKSVCVFNLAVDNGKSTDFFRINAWNGLGETAHKYLAKGKKIAVIGKLRPSTYQTKDGKTMMNLDVTADEIEFLSPKESEDFRDIKVTDLPF